MHKIVYSNSLLFILRFFFVPQKFHELSFFVAVKYQINN